MSAPVSADLLEIMAAPDTDGQGRLWVENGQIKGAGYEVPTDGGFPNFVKNAPPVQKTLRVTLPSCDTPTDAVLSYPEVPSTVPPEFQENRYKWSSLNNHQRGWLLDAGCGFGNRQTFQRMGYRYVGVDISSDGRHCNTNGGNGADLDFIADCHRLPLRNESFQAANTTAVIEHLSCPPVYVAEMARILKPGGLLVGSCSFLESEHLDSQHHYTSLGLYRLLRQGGFEVEHIFPGPTLWEMQSSSIWLSLPGHKTLGRWHRNLYLWLAGLKSHESRFSRSLRMAGIVCFIARKPVRSEH